jgi:hypothetical protein
LGKAVQVNAPTKNPEKKSKKSLAMPAGIVTNGVILSVLGGQMRKFTLRSVLILGAAFTLLAAFTPRANADCPACIRFYDFEGTDTPPYPVNLDSHMPALEIGAGTTLFLDNGTPGVAYPVGNTSQEAGLPLNVPAGAGPNLTGLGFHRSGQSNLGIEIPMPSSQGIYDVTSVSFAYEANGNGWNAVQLQISSDGGLSFTTIAGTLTALPATPGAVIMINIPSGTTLNINNLALRLLFTGGQSNGADLQFTIDNIQINGTIVPEPATVAGGLLGVLGLCWFQRRRLRLLLPLRRT